MQSNELLHTVMYFHLESEVPLSACNFHKALFHDFPYFFIWNILKLGLDHGVAKGAGFVGGVILQVFFQGHQGVWQTAVLDLAGLTKRHEPVSCPSLTVTGGAK